MKIAAIIPIKEHSSRVPGKNYRLMNGKPLFYYIINTLTQCDNIHYIIINTDSDIIRNKVESHFENNRKIIYYDRPRHLLGDTISTNKLIEDTIKNVSIDVDLYLQTHVTNPLLSKETIKQAIDEYSNNKHDSLFSVKTLYTRLYNDKNKPLNHDPNNLIPTQDLKPLYEENSCIYIFSKENFMKTRKRIGKNPYLFKMNDYESQDIDWSNDFTLTELMMGQRPNKTVLITGINGGIGSQLGQFFKLKNWKVIGIDIIGNDENCDIFYKCDIGDEMKLINVLRQIKEVHVIINNAAYQLCKKWVKSTISDWEKVMNVNLRSIFLISTHLHYLLKKVKGTIINISSVHATHTSENIGIYATSKGALTAMTRSMAIEYGKDNIRVNAILPGAINTKMLIAGLKRGHLGTSDEKGLVNKLGEKHLLGKIGEPWDVAEMVYFLADNRKAGFITGQGFLCRWWGND